MEEMKFLKELRNDILDESMPHKTSNGIKILQNSEKYNLKENINIYDI